MLDMKNFEGIKKVKNKNELDINHIYEILEQYKNEIGSKLELRENDKILADVDGKYEIDVYLSGEYIVIERIIESGFEKEKIELGVDLKSIDMAKADRMVDQIYDLLNTLEEDRKVVEPITGVKKVLFVNQDEGRIKNHFYVTTEANENVYEIKGNKILKEFTINNLSTKRKDISIQYSIGETCKYTIVKSPYNIINLTRKEHEIKTEFVGKVDMKNIVVRGDYSNNHFVIELNNIVIGAIDSLNDKTNDSYRIEINNLEYEYLVLALTVIIDTDKQLEE